MWEFEKIYKFLEIAGSKILGPFELLYTLGLAGYKSSAFSFNKF